MKTLKRHPRGFTLLELLVVVAILAALAMVVIPKLEGLIGNANHAVAAASANDTGRYIQIFRTTKLRYPNGYDSLMNATGDGLWAAADPSTTPVTRGLHVQLSGSTAKLTTTTLTTDDVTALTNAGILKLYNLGNYGTSTRPGDMFNTEASITSSMTVATVNTATSGGRKIIDHIYRDNLKAGGTSGTIGATGVTGAKLVVFGFGPHNELIGKTMLEAPAYANVDATLTYNRNLVIFEIVGTKATLRAIVGADGDLLDDLTTYMNRDVS